MDLMQAAAAVAHEKNISRGEVVEAMEQAVEKAGRSAYGQEQDLRAILNPDTKKIELFRCLEVAERVEQAATQITLEQAKLTHPEARVGDKITELLPSVEIGRLALRDGKRIIAERLRAAEQRQQYEAYSSRVREVVNGVVKRVERGYVILDLGPAEAILRREEMIPREHLRIDERVRALIGEVRRQDSGPQIFLSRASPLFLSRLLAQEVPEIQEQVIIVKSVARDAGSRAKVAVFSREGNLDPVSVCVGKHGSHVKPVSGELRGEKIDVVQWSSDPATFIVNALAPAAVSRLVLDRENRRVEAIVPGDQLSLAIGRRGQNVQLAKMLTGWYIDIVSEDEASEKRVLEQKSYSQQFSHSLEVDEVIAHILVVEGFRSVEDIADASLEELTNVEGFDGELAGELKRRAGAYLEQLSDQCDQLGITEELEEVSQLPLAMLVELGKAGVQTLDHLADLSSDELREILGGESISAPQADSLIMLARKHWFAGDSLDACSPAESDIPAAGDQGDQLG